MRTLNINKTIIKIANKGLNIIKSIPLALIKKSTQKIIDNSVKNMGKGKKIDLNKYKD